MIRIWSRMSAGMAIACLVVLHVSNVFAVDTTAVLRGGIAINEFLADPNGSKNFDTDGNGTADTTDEFVELINISAGPIDIGGLELWDDGTNQWFTFPAATTIDPGGRAAVVVGVQGGGSLPAVPAGSAIFDDGFGSGVLNNGGDNIVVYDPGADTYIQALYNGDGADDPTVDYAGDGFSGTATRIGPIEDFGSDTDGVSRVRSPEGDTNVADHDTVNMSLNASPGTPTAGFMPPPPMTDFTHKLPKPGEETLIDFSTFTGSGFDPDPSAGQLDSDNFATSGFGTDVSFGGSENSGDPARGADDGGVSTGGIYAFDVSNSGGADPNPALGVQPAGSDFTPGSIFLQLPNETDSVIDALDLSFDFLFYNDQERSQQFEVFYSTGGTFTHLGSLTLLTPEPSALEPEWEVFTIATSLSELGLEPGDFLTLRFDSDDFSGGGSRDEIAIDNISISQAAIPEPASAALLLLATGGLVMRRARRRA